METETRLETKKRADREAADVVKVHRLVAVTVLDVDVKRRRIALSMKKGPQHKG
jgi:ribosomal protein S1